MKHSPIWRRAAAVCHLSAVLAPAAWLDFQNRAGNRFHWSDFAGTDLLICLIFSLLPTLLFFLAAYLQRRHHQPVWGNLLASLFFLLAAAGWLYTLCDSWNLWGSLRAAGLLAPGQVRMLKAAAATGAVSALLPSLSQIPGALRKK